MFRKQVLDILRQRVPIERPNVQARTRKPSKSSKIQPIRPNRVIRQLPHVGAIPKEFRASMIDPHSTLPNVCLMGE
jgi:hypothetical protein